jgi:uncharacterized membrane protein YdjX (TVP38/TMEM64 family)
MSESSRGQWAPLLVLLALLAVLPIVGAWLLLGKADAVGERLDAESASAMVLFIVIGGVIVGVSLLPTYAVALVGGWVFGGTWGWLASLLAVAVGAAVSYGGAKWIARDRLLRHVAQRQRWEEFRRAMIGQRGLRAAGLIALLRLPPQMPFAMGNAMLTALGVPFWPFLLGTTVGMLPRITVTVGVGAALEQITFDEPADAGPKLLFIGLGVASIVVLGLWSRRVWKRLVAAELQGDDAPASTVPPDKATPEAS